MQVLVNEIALLIPDQKQRHLGFNCLDVLQNLGFLLEAACRSKPDRINLIPSRIHLKMTTQT